MAALCGQCVCVRGCEKRASSLMEGRIAHTLALSSVPVQLCFSLQLELLICSICGRGHGVKQNTCLTIVLLLRVAQVGPHPSNMAQLQGGACCQIGPRSSGGLGSWNGFDRIVLHLLHPRNRSPCFACHSAAAQSTSPLTEPPCVP
ncbi:hypothetical protein NQZ68_028239 [Dissostichus eleginoides]|nr:hypothetical protein NQZ68_028239 [Dissostichus eleginoides]